MFSFTSSYKPEIEGLTLSRVGISKMVLPITILSVFTNFDERF